MGGHLMTDTVLRQCHWAALGSTETLPGQPWFWAAGIAGTSSLLEEVLPLGETHQRLWQPPPHTKSDNRLIHLRNANYLVLRIKKSSSLI